MDPQQQWLESYPLYFGLLMGLRNGKEGLGFQDLGVSENRGL